MMNSDSLEAWREQVRSFVCDREWETFHSPKNLAMAMSVETAELMELFQWRDLEESRHAMSDPAFRQRVEEELADVFIYVLAFANTAGVDLPEAVAAKMRLNATKYPVHRARGRADKYTEYPGQ